MNNLKEHIAFKTVTLFLAVSLLLPTGVKFTHIFAHHKHDICKGEKATHLHKINADCDFYKFKLSHSYTIAFFNVELFSPQEKALKIVSQYQFLSEFQRLQTVLRGPPAFI
uniref:hypothetical protein n=1 Tax=Mariniflexile sp. TaxID=1979402 RepID=UPI0040480717